MLHLRPPQTTSRLFQHHTAGKRSHTHREVERALLSSFSKIHLRGRRVSSDRAAEPDSQPDQSPSTHVNMQYNRRTPPTITERPLENRLLGMASVVYGREAAHDCHLKANVGLLRNTAWPRESARAQAEGLGSEGRDADPRHGLPSGPAWQVRFLDSEPGSWQRSRAQESVAEACEPRGRAGPAAGPLQPRGCRRTQGGRTLASDLKELSKGSLPGCFSGKLCWHGLWGAALTQRGEQGWQACGHRQAAPPSSGAGDGHEPKGNTKPPHFLMLSLPSLNAGLTREENTSKGKTSAHGPRGRITMRQAPRRTRGGRKR